MDSSPHGATDGRRVVACATRVYGDRYNAEYMGYVNR